MRVYGQAVEVTTRLDTNRVAIGGSTILRAYAQVRADLRPKSDRIFSWYLDLASANSDVATADYASLTKPTSDNDPDTSSTGTTDAQGSRRGIYDTFLNTPGAGVAEPIELFSVKVTGAHSGVARFSIEPGTTVPALSEDFIVAGSDGAEFFTGGDYIAAFADLEVLQECDLRVSIRVQDDGSLEISFDPCPGFKHTVEVRTQLSGQSSWQPLPNAPHDSGRVVLPNSSTQQYFRVRRDLLPP
jgi:hypothetical protein